MTYLVDTDVLIDYFAHREPRASLVEQLASEADLALSVVTITEIRSGWTNERAEYFMPRLYKLFTIEAVTAAVAEHAGMWRQRYLAQGRPLTTPDTLIAATAHLRGHTLITNNRKDYPMPELTLHQANQG